MFKRIKQLSLILVLGPSLLLEAHGQDMSLSLEKCQELARANYPLIHQRGLIAKSRDYTIENARKGYLPQISIAGQATYQSAITELPINAPGINFPELKKDQYKVYAELDQKLFDGGAIRLQKENEAANADIAEQSLDVNLYQLREQVNELFFGLLVIDAQLQQNALLQQDIALGLQKMQAAIANGAALKSEADVLQADLLNARQHHTELLSGRTAFGNMLSLYIHQPLNAGITLKKPGIPSLADSITRPELALYASRLKGLDIQEKSIGIRNLPKFDLFFQGGYGRPALNILSPDFDAYYIGGVRLSWNFAGLYTQRNERSLIMVSRQQVGLEKEVFLFNNHLRMQQEMADVQSYRDLLTSDEEIIRLRRRVKDTSLAKLDNGAINSDDYLRDVHAEDQARLNKILHETQLLAAMYRHQTITGH